MVLNDDPAAMAKRALIDKLEENEEMFRLLVEGVKDYAIFMLDREGNVISWNAGAERIKGYSHDEIIGQHFSRFYTAADLERGHPQEMLDRALEAGSASEEAWRVRKDGSVFWASVVITAIYDAQKRLRGFAKVTRDLTERRQAEEMARMAAEQVAAERARVAEAQNAVTKRDEFISIAAHELRTPLTALRLKLQGAVQALGRIEAPLGPQAARLASRLEGAVSQMNRLTELVERVLDVTRIVAGKLVMLPEEIDLVETVRQVVEDMREEAARAGCDLRFSARGPLVGEWDRARLEQVAVNLLSNAVKYGAGAPIDVTLNATDGTARLTVTDHGIGISQADIERIFARFERAVSSRHYGGLGLGLYVTRNIVEAHGGSIHVESRPGEGSTFIVEMPRVRSG